MCHTVKRGRYYKCNCSWVGRIMARQSKFTDERKRQLEFLAKKGFTDKELVEAVGICEATLTVWKKRYPDFFADLKDWKAVADQKVVVSLYESARGYSHPETKAQWVESEIKVDGEWRRVGRWEYAHYTKHHPPNPTSIIYWTNNRMPQDWKARRTEINQGDDEITINIKVKGED